MAAPEHFLAAGNQLGEGPLWSSEHGALYWVDIKVCYQRGWEKLDAGEWTEADFDQIYELSQKINSEIFSIRGEN